MEWTDSAILLSANPQGESSLILSLLTREHGRHKGLLRGARRQRGLYQPGTTGRAFWQARLADHLGLYRLEAETAHAAALLDDPLRLGCLQAATSLIDLALPERQPYPALFLALNRLLEALSADTGWADSHLDLELTLLTDLGYGLDLARCAVTGATQDLAYISPKSGRAVSIAAGDDYRDKLLVLPRKLGGIGRNGSSDGEDLLDGLKLTGFFIERSALVPFGFRHPEGRIRYIERFARLIAKTADAQK